VPITPSPSLLRPQPTGNRPTRPLGDAVAPHTMLDRITRTVTGRQIHKPTFNSAV